MPNAQLITEQVTNWTLSDQLRRLDLPVGVNYGSEPKKVIELLETVARAHPKVLQDRRPEWSLSAYGDSSINFELRAWTEQTNSVQVHSDLTVAIYDAIYAAGMSFPFPQREVRVLSDPRLAASSISTNAEESPMIVSGHLRNHAPRTEGRATKKSNHKERKGHKFKLFLSSLPMFKSFRDLRSFLALENRLSRAGNLKSDPELFAPFAFFAVKCLRDLVGSATVGSSW